MLLAAAAALIFNLAGQLPDLVAVHFDALLSLEVGKVATDMQIASGPGLHLVVQEARRCRQPAPWQSP